MNKKGLTVGGMSAGEAACLPERPALLAGWALCNWMAASNSCCCGGVMDE
jgi:hypothetical protein